MVVYNLVIHPQPECTPGVCMEHANYPGGGFTEKQLTGTFHQCRWGKITKSPVFLYLYTSGSCVRGTLTAATGPGPPGTNRGAGWRQGRLQWCQGENLIIFLDQRFAQTNVNPESAWSMPAILVVLVVTPACNMLPRPSMSAGLVNKSDTIRCGSVFYPGIIISWVIIWLCGCFKCIWYWIQHQSLNTKLKTQSDFYSIMEKWTAWDSVTISTSGGCARETLTAAIGPGQTILMNRGAGSRQRRLQ